MNTNGPHGQVDFEIGNTLVYAVPLWQRSAYLDRLTAQWLPYYEISHFESNEIAGNAEELRGLLQDL